jgi:MoxR-like ATPase
LHHQQLGDVIRVMSVEHCLMVGGAGAGKGEIAYQTAEALGVPFYTLDQGSLSPQTPVSAIIGYMNSSGNYVGTTFRQAFEHGGLIFLDELDNAQPACLATVNAALAIREGQVLGWPGGQMVKRHKDFRVLAAANTFGRGPDRTYAARQRGDAATWDRFSILHLKYDHGLEDVLCRQTGLDEDRVVNVVRYVRSLRSNVEKQNLPVVIGMRASIGMCRLLQAGMSADAAIDARCRRGASDADWAKISHGCDFHPKPAPAWSATERPTERPLLTEGAKPGKPIAPIKPDAKISGNLILPSTIGGGMTGEYTIHESVPVGETATNHRINVSADIIKKIQAREKIQAIKALRSSFPQLGLVYAKGIVDQVDRDLKSMTDGIAPTFPTVKPPLTPKPYFPGKPTNHPDNPPWIKPEMYLDPKPGLFGDIPGQSPIPPKPPKPSGWADGEGPAQP